MTAGKPNQRRYLTIGVMVVIVVAVVRLVLAIGGGSISVSSAPPVKAESERVHRGEVSPVTAASPSPNGALLRLDTLKDIDERPLPELTRNPFEFGPTPQQIADAKRQQDIAAHPPPPPPPPPPPVPFKAMGYQQDTKGQRVAYLSDDQETYIVREGQEFGQRFRVMKITDASVEVQDETYHQVVQLPYPQ